MMNNENSIDSSYMFGTQRIVRQRMGKTKYGFPRLGFLHEAGLY